MKWRSLLPGLAAGLFLLGAWQAEAAPGPYIVELADAPALRAAQPERAGRSARPGRGPVDWRPHAEEVRQRQAAVRRMAEERGAVVKGSASIAANALFVEIDEGQARSLASLPGVKRVRPAREFRMTMDAALPLHRIREAWALAGGENRAGEGVRIAIIDSGIEASHPAFNAEGFGAGGLSEAGFFRRCRFPAARSSRRGRTCLLPVTGIPITPVRDHARPQERPRR